MTDDLRSKENERLRGEMADLPRWKQNCTHNPTPDIPRMLGRCPRCIREMEYILQKAEQPAVPPSQRIKVTFPNGQVRYAEHTYLFGQDTTCPVRIEIVPAASPADSLHDGACDYCGCIPSIAIPTYFCDSCAEKAMKWADKAEQPAEATTFTIKCLYCDQKFPSYDEAIHHEVTVCCPPYSGPAPIPEPVDWKGLYDQSMTTLFQLFQAAHVWRSGEFEVGYTPDCDPVSEQALKHAEELIAKYNSATQKEQG